MVMPIDAISLLIIKENDVASRSLAAAAVNTMPFSRFPFFETGSPALCKIQVRQFVLHVSLAIIKFISFPI